MSTEREGNVDACEYARYLESLRELYNSWLAQVNSHPFASTQTVQALLAVTAQLEAAEAFYRTYYRYKDES